MAFADGATMFRTRMLLRRVCLSNNLPTNIRENTDFPRQNPRQLLSAKAHFKGGV